MRRIFARSAGGRTRSRKDFSGKIKPFTIARAAAYATKASPVRRKTMRRRSYGKWSRPTIVLATPVYFRYTMSAQMKTLDRPLLRRISGNPRQGVLFYRRGPPKPALRLRNVRSDGFRGFPDRLDNPQEKGAAQGWAWHKGDILLKTAETSSGMGRNI